MHELVVFGAQEFRGRLLVFALLLAGLLSVAGFAKADTLEIELRIRDHLFFPSTLEIPANQKVKIRIYNEDPTPEEFESFELIAAITTPGLASTFIVTV